MTRADSPAAPSAAPPAVPSAARRDEGAALITVILLMFIVGALSVLVVGAVLSQVRPTVATQQSTRTVFAAEAGIQTALSQLKTATTTAGAVTTGDRRALPCTVTGSLAGTGGTATFSATVAYYRENPTGRDATWLGSAANTIACTAGSGTAQTPSYALVTSSGADSGAGVLVQGRELQAVYAFNVVNRHVPGGVISTATDAACLQASAASANATVSYVAGSSCDSGNPLQQWVYDTGYHLVLASSLVTTTSGGVTTTSGLCITQPALTASVRTVTLQACTLASRDPMQLWSYEGGARFRGQNADNSGFGANCLWSGTVGGSPVGRTLVAGGEGTCWSNAEDYGSFAPEPKVGAGAASLATTQVVSYLQFGRCMDVTFENINESSMIVYPCKQDPSTDPSTGHSNLFWNHRWYYGAETGVRSEPAGAASMPTRLRVLLHNDPAQQYCLTTPAAGVVPASVVFRACDGSASQQYARSYTTGDPATSYTFRTADGRCLGLGPTRNAGVTVSTIVAVTCSGGPDQKWNAPPTAQDAGVSGQQEVGVAGS